MWIEAIVMPREETVLPRPVRARGRAAIHEAGCAESQRFRSTVLDFLNSRQLMGAVKWVSDPGALPTVTLHCTPKVLEQLRSAPQFAAGRSLSLELQT